MGIEDISYCGSPAVEKSKMDVYYSIKLRLRELRREVDKLLDELEELRPEDE